MSNWIPIAFELESPDAEVPIGKVFNALLAMALTGFRVRLVPGHDAGLGVVVVEVDPTHCDDEIEHAFAGIRTIDGVRQVASLAEARAALDASLPRGTLYGAPFAPAVRTANRFERPDATGTHA